MKQPIYQVDAFTSRPFAATPPQSARWITRRTRNWMQNVAAEMNLAETAFLHPEGDGFRLRWFTPLVEAALCGHATLASAHVLWESGVCPRDRKRAFTRLAAC